MSIPITPEEFKQSSQYRNLPHEYTLHIAGPKRLIRCQLSCKYITWNVIRLKQAIVTFKTSTFFAVLPFVSRVTDASSHYAGPMAAASDVNALAGGNVTFRTLPATVAHATTFKVLTIPTAKHRTGSCEKNKEWDLSQMTNSVSDLLFYHLILEEQQLYVCCCHVLIQG